MRIFFIFLLHAFAGVVCAKVTNGAVPDSLKNKIDSLRTLADSGDYETRYLALTDAVIAITDFDNSLAIEFAYHALELSSQEKDTLRMIESNRFVGQLKRRMGDTHGGLTYLFTAFRLAEHADVEEELAWISNSLGLAYSNLAR